MKKTFTRIMAASLMAMCAASVIAAPARRTPRMVEQPNGEQLTIVNNGDEHFHYYTTLDGYMVNKGADGYYRYVNSADGVNVLTNMVASDAQYRSAEELAMLSSIDTKSVIENAFQVKAAKRNAPARFPAEGDLTEFPTKGSPKVLVLLVQFPDQKFYADNAGQLFTDMMSKPNYKDGKAFGSVYDYFVASSNGKFTPQIEVHGPYTTTQNESYYAKNDDALVGKMIAEACKALDGEINFKEFDTNNDGYVDNVYVIYAGLGANDGGDEATTIWPHQSLLSYTGNSITLDGVKVNSYGCSNEVDGDEQNCGIGTFCHEFSHVLGLPDLYPTNTNSAVAYSPNEWSLLDYGCYMGEGWVPVSYSVYERYFCDWLDPHELTAACNVTMKPSVDGGYTDAYKITVPNKATEYFLFENRQKVGWDQYLPGSGMLVWHIDYKASKWTNNSVNATQSHQYVDIVEACGYTSLDYEKEAGYTFPGTSGVTSLTGDTKPSLTSWMGVKLDPITEIAETDGVITFKFNGGGEEYNGVDEALADNGARITTCQGAVMVNADKATDVEIFNLQGASVVSAHQVAGIAAYDLPAGIYVVKAGAACCKVLVK